ncbi:hypothetical protein CJF42_25440, partial [Pseudoalteromonas sp. NBT06-2]|uniref:hypothetical protein n=1 Tax=Pseudoalteromonas sp. NBT06-2 TaxID=2025950 RepID=UPI000BA7D1D3
VRLEEQAVINAAKKGLLLLTLKEHSNHGEFEKKFTKFGIARRSAFDAMSIAKMFLSLPDSKVQTSALLNMNQSKLVELARLPIETLESLDDDDLCALSDLSVRELKKELQRLKAQNKALDIERADAINACEHERLRKNPTMRFDMPVIISQMRSDAIAYTGLLDEALVQTTEQVGQLIDNRTLNFDNRLAAAQTLHHCWASIYMQIGHMLERLNGEFGEQIQGIENLPRFTAAEWEYVESQRSRLLESFQLDMPERK